MDITKPIAIAIAAAAAVTAVPAAAQRVEGDANSPTVQYGRMLAEPGTFWLDSMDDTELIRYTTSRDVRLCLPEASGVNAAQRAIPLQISWDGRYTATLRPGNCFYFDAMRVQVKPAAPLPSGVTLRGRFETMR